MSPLAKLVEDAKVEGDVRVVWDNREFESGTRLQYEVAPLDGYRALMQDRSGRCATTWRPDSTPLEAVTDCLDMYLHILNHGV